MKSTECGLLELTRLIKGGQREFSEVFREDMSRIWLTFILSLSWSRTEFILFNCFGFFLLVLIYLNLIEIGRDYLVFTKLNPKFDSALFSINILQ